MLWTALCTLLLVAVSSSSSLFVAAEDTTSDCSSITEIACETEGFDTLCASLQLVGLDDDLATDMWTVFAPTDAAFMELGTSNLEYLGLTNDNMDDVDTNSTDSTSTTTTDLGPLIDLLLYHVIAGQVVTSADLPCEAGQNLVEMAVGANARSLCLAFQPTWIKGPFNRDEPNAPQYSMTDITACNGIVHVIDKVMLLEELPFELSTDDDERQTDATTMSPTATVMESEPPSPFFAPTTPAPTIVEVESSSIPSDAPSMVPSAMATPEPTTTTSSSSSPESLAPSEPTCPSVADIACSLEDFSTLCMLITELGLVDDLSSGTWTVFAPTNQAFMDTDINPGYDPSDLVLFHTIAGRVVTEADLTCDFPGVLTEMTNGVDTRTICREGGTVKYQKGQENDDPPNAPLIVSADIPACNGIIHVVNMVLLPPL